MHTLEYWEQLRNGDSDQVVLAVDGPPGTAASGFGTLAPLLDTPHSVWRALPGPAPGPDIRATGLDPYLEPWIREARATGLRVRAVLGSRLGGIFAGVFANTLADRQGVAPDVLLFDPELVDPGSFLDEFHAVLAGLDRCPVGDARWALERAAAAAVDDCADDVAALADRLHTLLAQVPGIGPADLDRASLRFAMLTLAELVDAPLLWSGRTALCSSSPDQGLTRSRNWLLLPEADLVDREIVFADDHDGVFTSPDAVRLASALLKPDLV